MVLVVGGLAWTSRPRKERVKPLNVAEFDPFDPRYQRLLSVPL